MTNLSGCEQVLELLSPYLDDRLPPEDRRRLEAHLEECPGCARQLQELRLVVGAVRNLPAVDVAASFDTMVVRRLRRERWWARLRVAAGLLLVAVGFGAGMLVERLREPAPPEPDRSTESVRSGPEEPRPGGLTLVLPDQDEPEAGGIELALPSPGVVPEIDPSAGLVVVPLEEGETDEASAGPVLRTVGDVEEEEAVVNGEALAESIVVSEERRPSPPEEADRTEVVFLAGTRLERAREAFAAGRLEEAFRHFTWVIRGAPWALQEDLVAAYTGRGSIHASRHHRAAALADFQEAVRLDPEEAGEAIASICQLLELPGALPPPPAEEPVERLRDTQLRALVAELCRRIPEHVEVDGDPEEAVGLVQITPLGLARICTDPLAGRLRDFMVRYPQHLRITR